MWLIKACLSTTEITFFFGQISLLNKQSAISWQTHTVLHGTEATAFHNSGLSTGSKSFNTQAKQPSKGETLRHRMSKSTFTRFTMLLTLTFLSYIQWPRTFHKFTTYFYNSHTTLLYFKILQTGSKLCVGLLGKLHVYCKCLYFLGLFISQKSAFRLCREFLLFL